MDALSIEDLLDNEFASAYLEEVFSSSKNVDIDREPLCENYNFHDMDFELFSDIKIRCAVFLEKYQEMIMSCGEWVLENRGTEHSALIYAGRDFGCNGFMDPGHWPEAVGEILGEATGEFTKIDLYVDAEQVCGFFGKCPDISELPEALNFSKKLTP
jgi:hypothetical protein